MNEEALRQASRGMMKAVQDMREVLRPRIGAVRRIAAELNITILDYHMQHRYDEDISESHGEVEDVWV